MAYKVEKNKNCIYNNNMIFTIGYAGTNIERFIQILRENSISFLIDVRSLPKSKYFKYFNDTFLKGSLAKFGIRYENWKIEFGVRQDNLEFYTDFILDYEKFAQSEQFQNGILKLKDLYKQNSNVCLMCAEIDPINCHRAILCAKEIYANDMKVSHIIAKRNGETYFESQEDFEKRLLKETKENNLTNAYRKQNKKIGHKLT